jgi:ferrous iron transport protein B
MASCCDTVETKIAFPADFTIALAGNPNSGKTTLFNALTGLRQKVANYPGVTVEKKTGRCKLTGGEWINVIDLPGTYSLISRSPDEQVAMEVLRGLRADTRAPDAVIVVVDASNLQRNLYLVSQLVELGRPLVVALNMMDIARRRGLNLSAERLSKQLGVPVIPVVGHKKQGIAELKAAISQAAVAPMPEWPLPESMQEELTLVAGGLGILLENNFDVGSALADGTSPRGKIPSAKADPTRLGTLPALAERLLIGDHAADIDSVAKQEPVKSLLDSAHSRLLRLGIDPMQADIEAHYRWIDGITAGALVPACEVLSLGVPDAKPTLNYATKGTHTDGRTLTERVDRIFIHKIWGLLIFALIMATLFVTLFWAAQPIMDAMKNGSDWLGVKVTSHMTDGPLKDLVTSGIFKGVGSVIVFIPQIAMLFLFLSILEDSGYLARAAFLMDRVLAKVGLHGKSFIPLLSSFACAIPGIMATRTIENRKDRLATILIAPFMSCSARLPVYTLLIGTFFASRGAFAQAGIMLACYALGIIAAAATAFVFRRSFLKGGATSFILELPTYKVPQVSQVVRTVWTNTWAFITKAGTTIFCLSVILWAMAYYPRLPKARVDVVESNAAQRYWSDRGVSEAVNNIITIGSPITADVPHHFGTGPVTDKVVTTQQADASAVHSRELLSAQQKELEGAKEKAVAGAQSEYSIAGRVGHTLEPVIKPLGFDWKMGVGLVGAFAAREVFVSTMGIVYSVGEVDADKTGTKDLADAMRQDRYTNGKLVWTPLVAISLLIWFVLAQQCMSTIAIVRRETGGWGWPIFMLVYMNGLAYVACLVVFQLGRAAGMA